jgi:hypothetical protein
MTTLNTTIPAEAPSSPSFPQTVLALDCCLRLEFDFRVDARGALEAIATTTKLLKEKAVSLGITLDDAPDFLGASVPDIKMVIPDPTAWVNPRQRGLGIIWSPGSAIDLYQVKQSCTILFSLTVQIAGTGNPRWAKRADLNPSQGEFYFETLQDKIAEFLKGGGLCAIFDLYESRVEGALDSLKVEGIDIRQVMPLYENS